MNDAGNSRKKVRQLSAGELDRLVDEGEEDVLRYFDLEHVRRPNLEVQRVNVDFPRWMVAALDREAARLSIPRQSVIKMWLDDRLRRNASNARDAGPRGQVPQG